MNNKETPQKSEWAKFYKDRQVGNFPKWPNEVMLRVLFGNYLDKPMPPQPDWSVLDVGCGFGNNLLPFAELGCDVYGVEIDPEIALLTSKILKDRGYLSTIVEGANCNIPYADNYFNLLLSIGTIHYEDSEDKVLAALKSFYRVLKPGGRLYLTTTGPENRIFKRAKSLGGNIYEIQNTDFRDGQKFYFFETEDKLKQICSQVFDGVETGQVTEKLMNMHCDSLITVCTKRL